MQATWNDNPIRNKTIELYEEIDQTCRKLFRNGMSIEQVKNHLQSKGIEISEYTNIVIEVAWMYK